MTDILQTFIFHIFQQNYTRHIRVKLLEVFYYFDDDFLKKISPIWKFSENVFSVITPIKSNW